MCANVRTKSMYIRTASSLDIQKQAYLFIDVFVMHVLTMCVRGKWCVSVCVCVGGGCSSVGRASDRHAADAGSIPRCGKGFFS